VQYKSNRSTTPEALFVLNGGLCRLISVLLLWGWISPAAVGQALPEHLIAEVQQAIEVSELLRLRVQPDSAYQSLAPMARKLDSLGYRTTPLYRRVQLELSVSQAKSERYLLALKGLNEVASSSYEAEEWWTYASAKLQLSPLDLRIREKARSRGHLREAIALIERKGLEDLRPQALYQSANWQANFGYQDSVRFYLDSLFKLPNITPGWLAAAYRMYAFTAVDDLAVQDRFFQKACRLYRQMGNYRDLSATTSTLGFSYLWMGHEEEGYQLLKTAMQYCEEGALRNQDVNLTRAGINRAKSKYFRKKNQLDSALHFASLGMGQEVEYWRNSAYYKAAEARQLYRNEEQELQLADRSKALRIERLRSYGLIGFLVLILLLSFWTIRLYGQLRKSNELTQNQAASLADAKGQLEESLRLQIMLKAELQHRVKNNMQLIMSIFNRGQKDIDDPELQTALNDRKEQIQSIALLHQKIDLQSADREVDPEEYLGELVTNIEKSYSGIFPDVRLHLDLNVDFIHIDTAVPLGLILNELVTNAYKYAFPQGGEGNIRVTFSKLPDHFYLRVADDGVGLPEDVNFRRHNSKGTRLIKGLVRQLGGTVEWVNGGTGLVVQVKYKAGLGELEL